MRLQRLIPWLIVLLVAQLALTLLLWRDDAGQLPVAAGPLLSFDRAAVDGIEISDGKQTLQLRKVGDHWVLPDVFDFPAAGFRVGGLLDELGALRSGLPVATSAASARRFRVAGDGFERRLRLMQGDTELAVLYLGDAAGPRRAYGRAGGDTAIYPLDFTAFQADATHDGWTDKTLLHREVAEITALRIGDIQLERDGGGWKLAGLAEGERTDQDAAAALVARLAGLDFMAVLGPVEAAPAGSALLDAELTLGDGKRVQYRFTDPGQGGDPLLRVSDRDHVLRIGSHVFAPLKAAGRDSLVSHADAVPAELPSGE